MAYAPATQCTGPDWAYGLVRLDHVVRGGDVHMTIDEHACTGAAHDYDRHDARQHAVRPHSMVNRHHAWPAQEKYAWREKVCQAYVWPREGLIIVRRHFPRPVQVRPIDPAHVTLTSFPAVRGLASSS